MGNCTITANAAAGLTYAAGNASYTLSVLDLKKQTITADAGSLSIIYGDSGSLTASSDVGLPVYFRSEDANIISIDNEGHYTACAAGSTSIYAVSDANGEYAGALLEIPVTVAAKDINTCTPIFTKLGPIAYRSFSQYLEIVSDDSDKTFLQRNKDYTISYSDEYYYTSNGTDLLAYVSDLKVTGTGNYQGTKTISQLRPAPNSVSLKALTQQEDGMLISWYNATSVLGYEIYRSINHSEFTLIKRISDIDTVSYLDKEATDSKYYYQYYVKVYTRDNNGIVSGDPSSTKYRSGSIADWDIQINADDIVYDGTAKTPDITIADEMYSLTKDTDYTVAYSNNINAGEATITVKGKGGYSRSNTATFTIQKAPQTITATEDSYELHQDNTAQLSAEGIGTISYQSVDDSIASVTKAGLITAVSGGETAITVQASGDKNHLEGTLSIPVTVEAHKIVIMEKVDPTCTETGLTEGSYCSICNKILKKQEVIPANGHTIVIDEAIAPTCTETGLTEGSHCSVCDAILKKQEIVPANGHTVVIDEAIAPTCTKTGLTEGSHCSVCDAILKKQESVPANGHTIVKDDAVEPTCSNIGLTEGSHCSVCGTAIDKQEAIPKLPHTIVKDDAVEPTCSNIGLTEGSHCSVCGTVIDKQEAIPKLPHTIVKDNAVKPTCTQTGLTEGSHCSVCGTIIKARSTVAALGHKYQTTISILKATTSKDGYIQTTKTCVNSCGFKEVKKTTIPKISSITLSTTTYAYDGKVHSPAVTVKNSKGQKLTLNKDYKVTYPTGRKNVGTYSVKVTFIGNYTGTSAKTFIINPKAISLRTLTGGSKKATISWYSYKTQTTGYQLQYSLKKTFTSAKTVTVSNTKASTTITKLSSKKTYYVRIRTYKKATKNYYSKWSAVKSVKVK